MSGFLDKQRKWVADYTGMKSLAPASAPAGGQGAPADPAAAEAERLKKLAADTAAAVRAQDWSKAAELLNAYSEADMDKKISELRISASQLQLIHDAACKNPAVGPNSNIAKLTDNIMLGGKFKSGDDVTNDMKSALIETAHNVQNRAKINAAAYGQAVMNACQDFQKYAKPKIEAKKNELTAGDLATALVNIAVPKVGDLIAKAVTNEIGKQVVSKVSDIAKDKLGKAVNSKDTDVAALEKVVDDLVDGARNLAASIADSVAPLIDKPCNDVIDAANKMSAGSELNAAGQDFIGPFYKADTNAIDATLEQYGIPSTASSKTNRVRIFTDLVKGFETALYRSGVTDQDLAVMGRTHMDREADAMGDKAAQEAKAEKEKELAGH